jgi:hypothetical protein
MSRSGSVNGRGLNTMFFSAAYTAAFSPNPIANDRQEILRNKGVRKRFRSLYFNSVKSTGHIHELNAARVLGLNAKIIDQIFPWLSLRETMRVKRSV